jgi:pilus assembly protein CpaB
VRSVPFLPARPRAERRRQRALNSTANKPPKVRRRLHRGGVLRWIRRFRVVVALMLALCAGAAALLAGEHSGVEKVTVVRVAHDVVAGEVLHPTSLEQTDVDAAAVPPNYEAELQEILGQTAAVALPAGAVVHPTQLVGPGLLTGHSPDTVAVPVRPADTALIGLLSPGQRVDVLASPETPKAAGESRRIAEAAPVIWIPQDESENWLGATSDSQNVVILAVDAPTAAQLAEATSSGRLHLTMVGAAD